MSNRVFFFPASGLEVAQRFLVVVKNTMEEANDPANGGDFQQSVDRALLFRILAGSPFTVADRDEKVCSLVGFKDAGHALHCAMLRGFPRDRLVLIKVELSEQAYEKLMADEHLKVLSEHSFGVYIYTLLSLEEPSARFSVLSQSDPEIVAAVEAFHRRF